jgi:hypothetical protein
MISNEIQLVTSKLFSENQNVNDIDAYKDLMLGPNVFNSFFFLMEI